MKRPAALLISAAGYSGSTARARSTSGNASTMDNSPDPVCDSAVSAAALRGSIASARRAASIARALSAPNLAEPLSRSEEHTSELQSLMRISYAVVCLKEKKHKHKNK